MNKPNTHKHITDEQLQQGLAGLHELGEIFDELCAGLEPSGGLRIKSIDFNDPEESGGEIHRNDWPQGLAAFLDEANWELTAKEHNLILDALESYWNLPRAWGVNLYIESRYIDAGPIDNPEVKDL